MKKLNQKPIPLFKYEDVVNTNKLILNHLKILIDRNSELEDLLKEAKKEIKNLNQLLKTQRY